MWTLLSPRKLFSDHLEVAVLGESDKGLCTLVRGSGKPVQWSIKAEVRRVLVRKGHFIKYIKITFRPTMFWSHVSSCYDQWKQPLY